MAARGDKKLKTAALWDYALRVLAGHAVSRAELRDKLERKAASAADVQPVLDRLAEYGYLDDQRFAEHFAALRKEDQRLGRARVLSDLRKRRVLAPLAEQAVGQAYAGADEAQLAEEHLRRRYAPRGGVPRLSGPKETASAYRRLRRAGFSHQVSIAALRRFSDADEMLERLEESPEEPGEPD
jgi:regulatory protein